MRSRRRTARSARLSAHWPPRARRSPPLPGPGGSGRRTARTRLRYSPVASRGKGCPEASPSGLAWMWSSMCRGCGGTSGRRCGAGGRVVLELVVVATFSTDIVDGPPGAGVPASVAPTVPSTASAASAMAPTTSRVTVRAAGPGYRSVVGDGTHRHHLSLGLRTDTSSHIPQAHARPHRRQLADVTGRLTSSRRQHWQSA